MNNQLNFADVILPLPLKQLFTYSIPHELNNEIAIGKRVIVQFGARKIYTAIIHSVHQNEPKEYKTKDIVSVLDENPIVNHYQLRLWQWIANYYMCSIGEVFKAALPSGLKLESETKVIYHHDKIDQKKFTSTETLILDFLANKNIASITEISNALNRKDSLPIIKSLLDKKAVLLEEKLRENYKPKTESYIKIHDRINSETRLNEIFDSLNRAPKQLHMLMSYIKLSGYLMNSKKVEVNRKQLIKKSETSATILKSLIDKDIFIEYEKSVSRLSEEVLEKSEIKELSDTQKKAFDAIHYQNKNKDVVLLHGITSSGKTEIYIHLIKEQIEKGKQVLYLLPEIALTAQIINRLKSVFGNRVGIYHSKFSDSERVEVYNNILEPTEKLKYDIVLGVRSSLFLPFSNLGLIIVDEEHENTYKQYDPAPRYNARDCSVVLAKMHQAKVLLGTATPSIESYFNAKAEKYGLVQLTSRFQDVKLPAIHLVDVLRAKKRKEMRSHFSLELIDSIKDSLVMDEQIILFQNRRGFAPYLECDMCGWIPYCTNCDVSLTYHRHKNEIVCHYCGYTISSPKTCKACGHSAIQTRGFGTEKIEDEIKIFFPEAKVARMDLDSTRSKNAFHNIITSFENGDIDILIGTQMVSKGLDFDNVSLVGILNADNMLNYPDFRAFERSYQLMSQVSGRAGRKNKQGKVIIQTSNPAHPILQFVLDTKYEEMYKSQLFERKNFNYPPFYRLINIGIRHKKQDIVDKAAHQLGVNMRKVFGKRVLGPEPPIISRVQNNYIQNIILKIERERSFQKAKEYLDEQIINLTTIDQYKSIYISIDVDPI
ncbi:MAG: primosomal protein N' [Marinilabiliales bacterium]|nr:MAG: primosomal protein N' [Marinilabiliales bacterium]